MKNVFDLDSESHWQAYRIANLFLVWKADDPDDKKQAQQIVALVIKQWYRLGRRHERIKMKLKRLKKLRCAKCDVALTEKNWGGYVKDFPVDGKVLPQVGQCKKCYYSKYEDYEPKDPDAIEIHIPSKAAGK